MSPLFAATLAAAAIIGYAPHAVAEPSCVPATSSAAPDCPNQPQPGPPRFSPYTDGYCVGNQYVPGLTDEDRTCYDGSMS